MPRSPLFVALLLLPALASPLYAQAPLAWRWKEKDSFFVEWKTHVLTSRTTAGRAGDMDEDTTIVYRVTVLKELPDRGVELEAHIESVKAKLVPARVDPRLLEGEVLRAAFDGRMNLTRLDGVDALMDKRFGAGALPPHAKFVRVEIDDLCRALLQDALIALPGRGVAAGEKWEQQTNRALVPIGRHVLNKTFTAEAGPAGQPGIPIAVTASSSLAPFRQEEFSLPYRIEDAELKGAEYRGSYQFDPAAGRVVQGETRLRSRLCATMVADDTRLPGDATQEHHTTVRILSTDPAATGLGPPEVPAAAALPREVTNSLGMKLMLIPAGRFTMGAPSTEEARFPDEGTHDVEISRSFYLGAHEVTRGQFRRFVEATGYQTDQERNPAGAMGYNEAAKRFEASRNYSWKNAGYLQTDAHPVVNVSWEDAKAFCAWLSKQEGKTYRLPTEAEWEYACRAGTTTRFWSGEREEDLLAVANVADAALQRQFPQIEAARGEDGHLFTAPVGSYRPNAWGLHDMHGNVTEWCADLYGPTTEGGRDPDGPPHGSERVQRGGSWGDCPRDCRAARRPSRPPRVGNANTGFRIALAVAPVPGEASATEDGPYKHLLTGEDARRAAELAAKARELRDAGRYAEALAPRALADLHTRLQGARHWQTVDAVVCLRAIEILSKLSDADLATLATVAGLRDEAAALYKQGRHAEGRALCDKAVATWSRLHGSDDPGGAGIYSSVGQVCDAQAKYDEATLLMRKSLEICRRGLGEDHPNMARGCNNVAGHLFALGKFEEAEPLYRQSLAISRAVLGPDDAYTAKANNDLGMCLLKLGRVAEAASQHEAALAICRRTAGEDHASTADSRDKLARALMTLGKLAEAEALLRANLEQRRRTLGEENVSTALAYSNLGANLAMQGKRAEAEPLLRRAMQLRVRLQGEAHPETLQVCAFLGEMLRSQGNTEEGERLLRRVEELRRQAHAQGG